MSTPEVLESLIHLHGGAELEVRYYIDNGIRLLAVRLGDCWTDPANVLLPHVIADAQDELLAVELECAEYAE